MSDPSRFEPDPGRADTLRQALGTAFGTGAAPILSRLTGGASGALTLRADLRDRACLVRGEAAQRGLRNPHHYTCMVSAAAAEVAPPTTFLDGSAGLERMAGMVAGSGAFAAGALDAHLRALERLRRVYAWDDEARLSSHNDPNRNNLLFDAERLWLIDWETAYRNDPLTDVAIAAENFATTSSNSRLPRVDCNSAPQGMFELGKLMLARFEEGFPEPDVKLALQLAERS